MKVQGKIVIEKQFISLSHSIKVQPSEVRNEFHTLYCERNSVVEVNIANAHVKISQDLFLWKTGLD